MFMKIILVVKRLLLPLLLLINLAYCNNNDNPDKNKPASAVTATPVGSYYLQVPTGWTTELIPFPIGFAPGIGYKGMEDLRFAKGWGDIISDEHWCYAFTWWLDGKPVINEGTLQQNLTEYYTGLVNRNINKKSIRENKIVPTVASIKTMATMSGDIATFTGTISMLDYHSENPIILNCMIHIKKCDTKDHTALLFQISPKPFDHLVWKQLNMLNTNFTCGN
jgi:hypothetical protein